MKLSEHFDSKEFLCKCGCGQGSPSELLVTRLEQLYNLMDAKAIIINSGYRCPAYSVKVGGSATDAHTRGIAADIVVKKQDGTLYTAEDIAEAAERVGFGGIGLMNNACHVDTRDSESYVNSHWFGDERDGRNYIKTFQRIRRITGYLVGTLDRFNDGKRAEEADRVHHGFDDEYYQHDLSGLMEV